MPFRHEISDGKREKRERKIREKGKETFTSCFS
jgi:hypothetical protein